jgi:citrate lyase gamma subunit
MVHLRDDPEIARKGRPTRSLNLVKAITENGASLKKYSVTDVELILSVLALNGGNVSRTARQVGEELRITIHPNTLKKWKNESFPTRYAQIQDELSGKINDVVTGRIGDLALRGTEIQETILERLADQLVREDDIPVKDLSPSLRNITQATDMNIKQKQLLEDKPTQIIEKRSIEDTVKELEDNDILIDIDPDDISEEDITVGHQENSDQ